MEKSKSSSPTHSMEVKGEWVSNPSAFCSDTAKFLKGLAQLREGYGCEYQGITILCVEKT